MKNRKQALGLIVASLGFIGAVGFLVWFNSQPTGTTNKQIEELAASMTNQHPELPKLTPQEAAGDAVMMGGGKKGKK